MTEFEITPFDWDTYQQTNPPVFTRKGVEVTQLTKFDVPNSHSPLRGVADNIIRGWDLDGKSSSGSVEQDLVFRKERKVYTRYVNIYDNGPGETLYITPDIADHYASARRIACKEIQIEVDAVR